MDKGTKITVGCLIGGIIGIAMVFGAIAFVYYGLRKNVAQHPIVEQVPIPTSVEKITTADQQLIRLNLSELDKYSAAVGDDPISSEKYIAIMLAPNTTQFTKQKFAQAINKRKVQWRVQVSSIKEDKDVIKTRFKLPYEFRRKNGSTGSSIHINCDFPKTSADQLINVRIDQWVTLSGQLNVDPNSDNNIRLTNPTLTKIP